MITLSKDEKGKYDVMVFKNEECDVELSSENQDGKDELWVASSTGSMRQEPWMIGKLYSNNEGDQIFVDMKIVNSDY